MLRDSPMTALQENLAAAGVIVHWDV
jgi:hypothetical protein